MAIFHRYVAKTYGLKKWKDTNDFLDQLSKKTGKLLKGGEPDNFNSAVRVLRDWQRGRLPYFVQPPDTEDYLAKVPFFVLLLCFSQFPCLQTNANAPRIEQMFNTMRVKNSFNEEDSTDPKGEFDKQGMKIKSEEDGSENEDNEDDGEEDEHQEVEGQQEKEEEEEQVQAKRVKGADGRRRPASAPAQKVSEKPPAKKPKRPPQQQVLPVSEFSHGADGGNKKRKRPKTGSK